MKSITESNSFAYLTDEGKGFVLGGPARIIPLSYFHEFMRDTMLIKSLNEFDDVIDNTDEEKLARGYPAYIKVNAKNNVITINS